jgi:hypothetical protein
MERIWAAAGKMNIYKSARGLIRRVSRILFHFSLDEIINVGEKHSKIVLVIYLFIFSFPPKNKNSGYRETRDLSPGHI